MSLCFETDKCDKNETDGRYEIWHIAVQLAVTALVSEVAVPIVPNLLPHFDPLKN